MPFNLLLFPLLGGYVFVTKCNITKYKALRYDGQRLLFASALVGCVLLFTSFFCVKILAVYAPETKTIYRSFIVLPFDYAATTFGAFLIGVLSWMPINLFYRENKGIRRAIRQNNDPLELLFLRSIDESKQVFITLKNHKVYIGWVVEIPNPTISKNIKLIPTLSGYRDAITKRFTIMTTYWHVYRKIQNNELKNLEQLDFAIVLPINEILSATQFDTTAYDAFGESPIIT